jgi:signal transduction histidine kinase
MHIGTGHQDPGTSAREGIHDLRNLFSVVASARHMLDDPLTTERRALLLDAIEDAAERGGRLTTTLLARSDGAGATEDLEVNGHLAGLEPLMRALAGRHVEVVLDRTSKRLPAKFEAAAFDAAILELVANASASLVTPGKIWIRIKGINNRIWIAIADTGRGLTLCELHRALQGDVAPAANGTGLGRVRHFVRAAHGRFRIRSRAGHGTVVSLILPMVLKVAVDKPCTVATSRVRRISKRKETANDKRQPTTA